MGNTHTFLIIILSKLFMSFGLEFGLQKNNKIFNISIKLIILELVLNIPYGNFKKDKYECVFFCNGFKVE